MFQVNKISDSLLGLVGFKQPYNPKYAILDADNLASRSGLYVNDNAYAKVEFIRDNHDYGRISDADFNDFLKGMQKSSITNVCTQVFSEFDFIDRNLLFKYASNKIDAETLPSGFVGYKIQVANDKNCAFKINKVILNFNGTGDIELLLWNTGSKTPLKTKTISITSDSQVEELGWILDNSETTYKGDYYIGYNTDSLTVAPFKREWNNASVLGAIRNLSVEKVSVAGHNSTTLFDLDLVDGLSQDNGLNLDVTVYDDFTDFILSNEMLFAKAISLEFMMRCLQMYISSVRSSANEIRSQELYQKIMLEIEGTRGRDSAIPIKGLREQLLGEITLLKSEIKKMKLGFLKSRQFLTYSMN